MIQRLAFCLMLLPGLALARAAQPPAPPPPASVLLTPPAQCEAAIAAVETEAKLPARILASIAQRESGRTDPQAGRVRAWPWTINFEGQGRFFATKAEAIEAVQAIRAAGGQSVDVGCMQINLMHHAGAFASLEDAFDPRVNAAYAGRFIKALFGSLNDWGLAIAAYHSRTPGIGEPYRDMVVAAWKPTDPVVLSRLTFQPLPAYFPPIAGLPSGRGPRVGAMPIVIGPNMAYRAFVQPVSAYQSFKTPTLVYGDFSRKAFKVRGAPLDMRVGSGFGRGLVFPKGVIDRNTVKVEKAPVKRTRESG